MILLVVLTVMFMGIGSFVGIVNTTLSTTFMSVQSPKSASVSIPSILMITLIR